MHRIVAVGLGLVLVASFGSCGPRRKVPAATDGAGGGGDGGGGGGGGSAGSAGTLTLSGTLCTRPAPKLINPVKTVLMIDTSGSMNVSDPAARRAKAAQELLDLWSSHPDHSFAIINFNARVWVNGALAPTTGAFTNDKATLVAAVKQLVLADGTTDHHGAMIQLRRLLEQDLKQTDPFDLTRTRYQVILLSDGLPSPGCKAGCGAKDDPLYDVWCNQPRSSWCKALSLSPAQCAQQMSWFPYLQPCAAYNTEKDVLAELQQIVKLAQAHEVGQLQLHALALVTQSPLSTDPAAFLKAAAKAGGGTFHHLTAAAQIDFAKVASLTPLPLTQIYGLRSLVVDNLNARLFNGAPAPDSDGDGLTDAQEATLTGLSPLKVDSDGDGFGDLLEWRLQGKGLDPVAFDKGCAAAGLVDLDGDGLAACEEQALGTDPKLADSDADAFHDGLELRFGTWATKMDAEQDPDGDGLKNGAEIMAHTDPLRPDAKLDHVRVSYALKQVQGSGGKQCYELTARGLRTAALQGGADNTFMVLFDEGWLDVASDHGLVTAACVRAGHAASGERKVSFTPADLYPLDKLRQLLAAGASPCIRP